MLAKGFFAGITMPAACPNEVTLTSAPMWSKTRVDRRLPRTGEAWRRV